jgi:hypothetical protein
VTWAFGLSALVLAFTLLEHARASGAIAQSVRAQH